MAFLKKTRAHFDAALKKTEIKSLHGSIREGLIRYCNETLLRI
jgi:hypothetical protein